MNQGTDHRLEDSDWAFLRRELIAMAGDDLRVRAELAADGSLFNGYHPRMRSIHDKHAARLSEIVTRYGWPGEPQVGIEGARAAWLIVQHAIGHPALQRRALSALQSAVTQGAAPAVQAAMLEDRIRVSEGRPQLYGTQYDWDSTGALSPLPIEDPAGLEERRRAVGLGPLDEEVRARRWEAEQSAERPPGDWEARQREMDDWYRQSGWRP